MRLILGSQAKVPTEMLFLETSEIPVKHVRSVRRLMYLHTLLKRHDNEITKRVYKAMKEQPLKDDWIQVNQDLRYGEILAGRPGAWFVKRYILYVCNQKNKKGTYFEIQNLAFTVYDSRAYTDVFYGGTYPEKNY